VNKNRTELAEELYRDLLSAVASFSAGPAERKESFEKLLVRALCTAGIRLMAQRGASGEAQSVAHLLSRQGLLSASLADTTICRTEEAVAAAHTALQAGVHFHSGLARELDAALKQPASFENIARILRILDLLGAISGCCNSSRLELMAYPDKKVQSRAALLIGRAVKNPAWLSRCFNDGDARVQASAVEAMWDMPAERARPLLMAATKSRNNRVAANALVGLYHHGDRSALNGLLEMARHPEQSFRLSAIWAMGKTADPHFVPFLTQLFKQSDGKVRLAVTRALTQIRRREKAAAVPDSVRPDPFRVEIKHPWRARPD